MIIGGYSNSSVKSLRTMVNLPSMVERWYTLNAKYNIRSTTLPADSFIYQIIQSNKRYAKLKLIEKKITHKIFLQKLHLQKPFFLIDPKLSLIPRKR